MVERRKGERRNWRSKPRFPLLDSEGTLVMSNRRRTVDRRAGSHPQPLQVGNPDRLRLYIHEKVRELSRDTAKSLVLGRAPGCDIEVQASHVSRRHAAIEYVVSGFVLIDDSTNGTYIRFDDGRERHLIKDQLLVEGSGIISLGKPIAQRDSNLIYFWCA
jgi:hypothetical protein